MRMNYETKFLQSFKQSLQIIQYTGVLHLQYHKIQNTYSKWVIFGDV